jgi:hypothetical protein
MKNIIFFSAMFLVLIMIFLFPGTARIALLMHEIANGSSFEYQGGKYSVVDFVLVGNVYNGGFALSAIEIYDQEPIILHLQSPINNIQDAMQSRVLIFDREVSNKCVLYKINYEPLASDYFLVNSNENSFYTISQESLSRIDLNKLCVSVIKETK